MNFASEIVNDIARKAKKRLLLIIILVAALVVSNICWGYAYTQKCRIVQNVAYVVPSEPIVQVDQIKRKVMPRKVSRYEKV